MRLPPWNDAMSDGCSIPECLRPFVAVTPMQRIVCVQHDRAYYFGGSASDRLYVDLSWAMALLAADMPAWQVEWWLTIVRATGGPQFRQPYSWAFGGQVFAYTAWPGVEVNGLTGLSEPGGDNP